MLRLIGIVASLLLAFGCSSDPSASDATFCLSALDSAEAQLDDFRAAYRDPASIPRSFENDRVRFVGVTDWTSGFVAGSFWHLYDYTRDPSWRASAEAWTVVLESQKENSGTHDVGFMVFNSFGNGLRLAGNESFEAVIIDAAESLMTRFNATVGATRSWDHGDWEFPVIIDNMMNLELLYVASQLSDDDRFSGAASTHALTTLEHHFRPDYSSYHVVDFDPSTGAVLNKQTHQGIADDSSWARGQAWGLYGYTMAYRFSREPQFLELAESIAGFYLGHPNLPEDKVPYFDFDAPDDPDVENVRDSAAAAIAASALLELADFTSEQRAALYRTAALDMLRSLSSPDYASSQGENGHFLLQHATGRWQADDEVDAALNYADYYYLEALIRCARQGNLLHGKLR